MSVPAAYARDENFVPVVTLGFSASKAITYVGSTTGATGATTLFNVTGVVALRLFGVVSGTDVTGSGTIEAGIAGNTAVLLAQTTGTALDVGEIWIDNAPASVEALPGLFILSDTDIIQTIATNTLTAGTITYYCLWTPITPNASVTAA